MSLVKWLGIVKIVNVESTSVFIFVYVTSFLCALYDIFDIFVVTSVASQICAQVLVLGHRLNISKCRF